MPYTSRCKDITKEQPILINLSCYLPVQKGPEIGTTMPWIVVLKRKISSRDFTIFYLFDCNKLLVGRLWADNSHRSDASEKLGRVNAGLLLLLQVHLLLPQLILWANTLGWLGALYTKKSMITLRNAYLTSRNIQYNWGRHFWWWVNLKMPTSELPTSRQS